MSVRRRTLGAFTPSRFAIAPTVQPGARDDGPPRETTIAAISVQRLAPACFGILCHRRDQCARYLAVDFTTADAETLITCRRGDGLPMFVAVAPLPARRPA